MCRRFESDADVFLDEVGVDRDGGGGPLAGGGDHLGARVSGVPGDPHARNARPAGRLDLDEAAAVDRAAERRDQAVLARVERRADEDRGARDLATVLE